MAVAEAIGVDAAVGRFAGGPRLGVGGLDVADVTGAGTGLDAEAVQRKIGILRQVLARHPDAADPLSALAAFGGFEIAMMVGAVLQAALERRVILVDGFITGSAVLVAARLQPAVLQRCVFAHRSGERGHALMLVKPQFEAVRDFHNGYAAARLNGKWGLIDKAGEWKLQPQFDAIKDVTLVE